MSLLEQDGQKLVSRLRQSDHNAFNEAYAIYCKRVYAITLKMVKDSDVAAEITQEVFMRLWLHRDTLDERFPVGPFLLTIAKRLTLDVLKKTANSKMLIDRMWNRMPQTNDNISTIVEVKDYERIKQNVICNLSPQQQLVYRMSREEGLTYEEIALRLDISRNTVKYHLMEVLKKLRYAFLKAGLQASAVMLIIIAGI